MNEQRARKRKLPTGAVLLHDPALNKGTAFSEKERDALGLQGLLPPRVSTQDEQVKRVMSNYAKKDNDLERYVHLVSLQDRNETLFYRVIIDHVEELMPIVYTPTVGKACQEYGHIFRRSRGIFVSRRHRGRVAEVLRNWPADDIRVIVVTDGERILGLGDLGANGMGIPVGKLSLYTACAGVAPRTTLPVTVDVGTDNHALWEDPLYIGDQVKRLRGDEYVELMDEFVSAVQKVFPDALIQFEDFATRNAFGLLNRYRDKVRCFNDDIQGTAAVVLAGLYSALRITGGSLSEQRILFLGAGAAAIGIGELIAAAMEREGVSSEDARSNLWFVDSKGLVVASRDDLAEHKRGFAHEHGQIGNFADAVRTLEPNAIIGVSGQGGAFGSDVLDEMARINDRPIVFALSNPTSNSECTAEAAYKSSGGRAIFASGSPFDPVTLDGRTIVPGQGNNAYIFPGLGLGVVVSGARRVTDEMFFAAARTLADQVDEAVLESGCIYPPLSRIRDVSAHIATAVVKEASASGLATRSIPTDTAGAVRAAMYDPEYESYV